MGWVPRPRPDLANGDHYYGEPAGSWSLVGQGEILENGDLQKLPTRAVLIPVVRKYVIEGIPTEIPDVVLNATALQQVKAIVAQKRPSIADGSRVRAVFSHGVLTLEAARDGESWTELWRSVVTPGTDTWRQDAVSPSSVTAERTARR